MESDTFHPVSKSGNIFGSLFAGTCEKICEIITGNTANILKLINNASESCIHITSDA